ncbi:cell division control protein 25 [Gaeumannomyces tritici R3-111a-1]|uniref:Class E vacuolar protein-sorting machinery protein HSE1 n=1 Tax=Gaeumannomyces tritici (strain R3-111a-1) TaxID=644352 RepID=J3PHB7_GAET3|nr:cell division control protein 25 [Gaeumannomyces tritici R3-111a-1]EJT69277.1 cell division control protein 25 [Gaeumannomyces tritici R3-111a-1]
MLMTQTAVSALGQAQNSSAPISSSARLSRATHSQSSRQPLPGDYDSDFHRSHHATRPPTAHMNGIMGTAPPGSMYVRALYDYEADDRTSLSFHEGDVIQVITQLESGWWDGVINGVRGWFPSNYCQIIDDFPEPEQNGVSENVDEEPEEDVYEESFDEEEEEDDDLDGTGVVPLEKPDSGTSKSGADFWIPQATPDGRLFYYNTMTGETSVELPLESPTSLGETGPRDRMNVNIPEKTRPPPEMMARGLTQDEDDDSDVNSASELEGESIMLGGPSRAMQPRNRRSNPNDILSPSASMDSMNGQTPVVRGRNEMFNGASNNLNPTPMIASATSFSTFNLPSAANIPRSFFDDGSTPPLTWARLVNSMKRSIERYREAIKSNNRSEYVARAEDISDHLRLLLAAGSGTTDNHSGQPSIISTNKALYPHFRDMMSKFSKLVISSHIAAADWPNAESVQKCLQESDGVLLGVFSYVEVARQQRGEEIPRLFPGFVIGSTAGGSWQNNGLGGRDPITANFLDDDEGAVEPTAVLDGKLLERLDELKRMLVSSIRELDKSLVVTDKVVVPYRHEVIGNNVCSAGGKVLETFKPWIAMIESIDLSSLGNTFQTPQLSDFSTNKQSLYDNISDLILGCQAVAGPLADEWSEVRGEALENRLEYVRQCGRALETNSSHIGFSLQLLSEQVQFNTQQQMEARAQENQFQREPPRRTETMPYQPSHQRTESQRTEPRVTAPQRPPFMQSQSFTDGDPVPNPTFRQVGNSAKLKKLLGEDPSPQTQADDTPDFLRLDYEEDISWDTKPESPTVKGGSLLALVEQLTRHDKLDSSFNNTFLLTYRSFTTARELFELLVKRFGIQPPEGLSQADFEVWRERKQKLIRFRVVNIMKSWFDNFWMEDSSLDETKQLIRDVYTFARDTVRSTETPGSAPLMTLLDQRLSGKEAGARRLIQNPNQPTPPPIMPKNMKKLKFLDIDPIEFARQLTIIESRLYAKIKPTECLNKTWQKKIPEGAPEAAPNVKALILHSNQMTNWVAEMILAQSDPKKRGVVIKHFVTVADKCRALNNFSTLTSIISALGTAPIARLKRTWDIVTQRTSTTLETMRRLMASTKNFGEYREALHASNPPCIPFFGVYLTDLTFIEDGIPSIIKKTNLINFAKRAKTAEVIRDIQQYQNVAYSLQPVNELQDYILSNMQAAGDVHEMYDKSLQVEPREREDEKIVRVLAESGFL